MRVQAKWIVALPILGIVLLLAGCGGNGPQGTWWGQRYSGTRPMGLTQLTLDKSGEADFVYYTDPSGTQIDTEYTGTWVVNDGDLVLTMNRPAMGTTLEFPTTLEEDGLGNPTLTLRGTDTSDPVLVMYRDKDLALDSASDVGE